MIRTMFDGNIFAADDFISNDQVAITENDIYDHVSIIASIQTDVTENEEEQEQIIEKVSKKEAFMSVEKLENFASQTGDHDLLDKVFNIKQKLMKNRLIQKLLKQT